jgi:hypothetical protein
MNRAEHLQWCKDRALEYAKAGDSSQALASMLSDLAKHPETVSSVQSCGGMGMMLLAGGHLSQRHQIIEFINGFN